MLVKHSRVNCVSKLNCGLSKRMPSSWTILVGDALAPVLAAGLLHAEREAVQRDVEDVAALAFEPGGEAAVVVVLLEYADAMAVAGEDVRCGEAAQARADHDDVVRVFRAAQWVAWSAGACRRGGRRRTSCSEWSRSELSLSRSCLSGAAVRAAALSSLRRQWAARAGSPSRSPRASRRRSRGSPGPCRRGTAHRRTCGPNVRLLAATAVDGAAQVPGELLNRARREAVDVDGVGARVEGERCGDLVGAVPRSRSFWPT